VLWVGDLGFRLEPQGASRRPSVSSQRPSAKPGPKQTPDPGLLSQDFPVAIPEQGEEFRVEQTGPQGQIPDKEILDLNDSDLLEEEET